MMAGLCELAGLCRRFPNRGGGSSRMGAASRVIHLSILRPRQSPDAQVRSMAAVERQWWFVGEFGDPESVHVVSDATHTTDVQTERVVGVGLSVGSGRRPSTSLCTPWPLSRGSVLPRPRPAGNGRTPQIRGRPGPGPGDFCVSCPPPLHRDDAGVPSPSRAVAAWRPSCACQSAGVA